ncbi:MAG: ATPase [Armatimonadetes bacterium]|nr:ATPase [Armatimonadota bacterium]
MERPITFLCLASYFKGTTFLEECKRLGIRTLLLTTEELRHKDWPWDCVDERFFMPDLYKQPDVTRAVSYLARTHKIDRIIPLDDFDVETAASLREHLRSPGMGDTTARHFRDKLAMRVQARDEGILVPDFVHILNHEEIHEFTQRVPPPWVLKPRSEAGSVGIKKVHSAEQLWDLVNALGDQQSYYLLEAYVKGDVYHVDSVVYDKQVKFARAHRYGVPPFNIWNEGGVFKSQSLAVDDPLGQELCKLNRQIVKAMRLVRGVTHTEFIRGYDDGRLYFLEKAARVGGANIDILIEAESGVNLWREWARLELTYLHKDPYAPPQPRNDNAGLLVCLSRHESADLGQFTDPELVWSYARDHHVAMVVASHDAGRVQYLMDDYTRRLQHEILAIQPPTDKVVH